jgi:U3 small nucleolar RNA-associated protein 11
MGIKKAIPKRPYKERAQPKWHKAGPLEKHKDYVVRAAKQHQVDAQKKLVKEQIAKKNEDEYHIDMAHAHKDTKSAVTVVEKLPLPKLLPHEEDDAQLRNARIQQARKPGSEKQKLFLKKKFPSQS